MAPPSTSSSKEYSSMLIAAVAGGAILATGVLIRDVLQKRSKKNRNGWGSLLDQKRNSNARGGTRRSGRGGRSGEEADEDSSPRDWSVQDVGAWCEREGFPHSISDTLISNYIDGETLLSLTDEQCLTMGIEALGLRTKLLRCIARIATPAPSVIPITRSHSVADAPPVLAEFDSSRSKALLQQLDHLHKTISSNNFERLPAQGQAQMVSTCLTILQQAVASAESFPESERVHILRRVKEIFVLLEKFENNNTNSTTSSSELDATAGHRHTGVDHAAAHQHSHHGDLIALLDGVYQGLEQSNFQNSADLMPYSDTLEKIIKGPVEILSNATVTEKLRQCMDLLMIRSKELSAKSKKGSNQSSAQKRGDVGTMSDDDALAAQTLSEQLDQIRSVLMANTFRSAPPQKQKELVSGMLPLLEKIKELAASLQGDGARQITAKLEEVYSLLKPILAGGSAIQDTTNIRQTPQKKNSSSELHKSLRELHEVIRTKTFRHLLELKPYAETVQRLMQLDEISSDPEMCTLIESCMNLLVERSKGIQANSDVPAGESAAEAAAMSAEHGAPPSQAKAVVEQLDRIITVLQSPAYQSLPKDRKRSLRKSSLTMLENISNNLEQLSLGDRREVLQRASALANVLRQAQEDQDEEDDEQENGDNDNEAEEEESAIEELEDGDEDTILSQQQQLNGKKKILMVRRLTELMRHGGFLTLPAREQFDTMQRLMQLLQYLTPEEAALHRTVVEDAMSAVEKIQEHIQKSASSISASSNVIDFFPRITERLIEDSFLVQTSPFELYCLQTVVSLGQSLLRDLSSDTRSTLQEIIVPIQELLLAKLTPSAHENPKEMLGSKHETGHAHCKFLRENAGSADGEKGKYFVSIYVDEDNEDDDEDDVDIDDEEEQDLDIEQPARTAHDIAIVYSSDSDAQTSYHILQNALEDFHGFQVLDAIGSKDPIEVVVEKVFQSMQGIKSPARVLVIRLEEVEQQSIESSSDDLLALCPPNVHFMYLQQSPNSVHIVYSSFGKKQGEWLVNVDADAAKILPMSFPFSCSLRGHFLEAIHSEGLAGKQDTLSAGDILDFILRRICPTYATASRMEGNAWRKASAGLRVPFFYGLQSVAI